MRERKEKAEVTSIWVLTDGLTNEGLTRKEVFPFFFKKKKT